MQQNIVMPKKNEKKSCSECGGSGKVPCQGCDGSGGASDYAPSEDVRWSSCASCHGTGKCDCPVCDGTGTK